MNRRVKLVLVSLVSLGLSSVAVAQPGSVRDRRTQAPPAAAHPTDAPPPPRAERRGTRRGQVWVEGRWDWKDGKWAWVPGHFEKERPGKRWRAGQWERKGDRYEWSGDIWEDLPAFPSGPPPAAKVERRPAPRRGQVWIEGRWDWQNGDWVWVKGRWEPAQPGKRWQAGRWEQQGNRYTYIADSWIDLPRFPTAEPPAPKAERRPPPRRGQVWVEGRWDWQEGDWVWIKGKWEKQRPGKSWRAGKWERKGDRFEWTADAWDDLPAYPTAPPPAPRPESQRPRAGYIWVAGHYEWKDGDYAWMPGHWERTKAGMTWNDGRWEKQGDRYVWVAGGWR